MKPNQRGLSRFSNPKNLAAEASFVLLSPLRSTLFGDVFAAFQQITTLQNVWFAWDKLGINQGSDLETNSSA
jgi:hypothetical protein